MARKTYDTFGQAADAVCAYIQQQPGAESNETPYDMENQEGIPFQAFAVSGASWTAYIGLDWRTGKWRVSHKPFTLRGLGRPPITE